MYVCMYPRNGCVQHTWLFAWRPYKLRDYGCWLKGFPRHRHIASSPAPSAVVEQQVKARGNCTVVTTTVQAAPSTPTSEVNRLWAGRTWFDSWQQQGEFLFASASTQALGPKLLFSGYRGLFPRGLSGRGVKLTNHLHLASKLRVELYLHFPSFSPWCGA
jgi:hypothetical protein